MARIVFDLDGTLIDSAPDIAAAANRTLQEFGIKPLTLAEARGFVGAGAPVFVERMAAARDIVDPSPLLPRFLHHYEGAVSETVIYPGADSVLRRLKAEGYRLGLCTNKPIAPTQIVLAHFGWSQMFEVVIGGDSLAVRKPDPAPLHAAFAELGDGFAIYVGDSEVDTEAAQRAGIPMLLFTRGYRKVPVSKLPHAAAFDDWSEVPGLVTSGGIRRPI